MSFFRFFSPTSHHLDSPFAKIQRFSLRLCNSVALDIRFRPSSCSKRCTVNGQKTPKKAPPSGRWRFDGSVLLFEGSEGSSQSSFLGESKHLRFSRVFLGLFVTCYPPPPPKKKASGWPNNCPTKIKHATSGLIMLITLMTYKNLKDLQSTFHL